MPFSRTFRTSETQELLEGRLVGRMLLQRLAAGVKLQHAPCRSRAARLAYAHAPNNNECVCVESLRVLHLSDIAKSVVCTVLFV